jgi:hypothetical protein
MWHMWHKGAQAASSAALASKGIAMARAGYRRKSAREIARNRILILAGWTGLAFFLILAGLSFLYVEGYLTTLYASGFSQADFDAIQSGDTVDSVIERIGLPLSRKWAQAWIWDYKGAARVTFAGDSIENAAVLVDDPLGILPQSVYGLSRSGVESALGPPTRASYLSGMKGYEEWRYSLYLTHHPHFEKILVVDLIRNQVVTKIEKTHLPPSW